MDKKTAKRKLLRRKYKRYAAAVAGAAIMAGVALPGLPVASAATPASPNPITLKSTLHDSDKNIKQVTAEKSEKNQKNEKTKKPPGRGWHEHNHSWPGSDENQGWYQDGKIYYRSDNHYNDYWRYASYVSSPVEFFKDRASSYGFDRYRDSFTLLSQNNGSATILVKKATTGKQYIVELDRDHYNSWDIIAVRGILR
jgi:hypothetical protein